MTEGRAALLAILARADVRRHEIARRCRVSPSRVSKWASGLTKPSARARAVLEETYRIPRHAWDTERSQSVARTAVNR